MPKLGLVDRARLYPLRRCFSGQEAGRGARGLSRKPFRVQDPVGHPTPNEAERFKAPVLKFGCGRLGAYRGVPKRRGLSGFSAPEIAPCPFSSHRVLPSSVANSVATYPGRSHGLGLRPLPFTRGRAIAAAQRTILTGRAHSEDEARIGRLPARPGYYSIARREQTGKAAPGSPELDPRGGAPPRQQTAAKPRPSTLSLAESPRDEGSPYVLLTEVADGHFFGIQKTWQRVRRKAGLDNVRIHDLRHSFASIAVSGGDRLYLVGKVLGHRQFRTTERYAHLKDDPLRAVANRTSERIAAIMQGDRGTEVVPLPSSKAAE
jgi:hypothetical protein